MRCVEGWSMVIPWDGFPLGDLFKRFEPGGGAKFVEFTGAARRWWAAARPKVSGWTRRPPRAACTGKSSPTRMARPYGWSSRGSTGFKGIKSIVKIKFTDKQPVNTSHDSRRVLRVLFERQPRPHQFHFSGPGHRAPHRRIPDAKDADVQRLRRAGRLTLHGHGPSEELLGHFSAAIHAAMSLITSTGTCPGVSYSAGTLLPMPGRKK